MNRKKIVIVNNNLNIGGVQKALVNLLKEINDTHDVTLFTFSNSGGYKENIPKEVKVIEANPFLKLLGISQKQSKSEGLFLFLLRAVLVIWTRIFNNHIPFKMLFITQKKLKSYDIAISFLHCSNEKSFYGGCNEFVLTKIDAKKKISFVHCDYLNFGGNTFKNKKIYRQFDVIATVSNGCRNSFIQSIPDLSSKTVQVKNCHNYKEIIRNADEAPIIFDSNCFNIVTVARLSKEKGILRTLNIITNIIKKNDKLRWHIIGDGDERKEIEEYITLNALKDNVILYGNQVNPYRYMKNADLFLLPSYHEAAPMVFDEAKCLNIPILATNTTSAKEMIEDCNAGWVCENSSEGIQVKIEYILNNLNVLQEVRDNLRQYNFNNFNALKEFEQLLEGVV